MKAFCVGVVLLVAATVSVESLLWGSAPDWDDLRITWGINPFNHFNKQPRTQVDAVELGFQPVGRGKACGGSGDYNGFAYVKDDDHALTLLYDIDGFIAGIQHGIPKALAESKGYPSQKLQPPFVFTEDRYVLTAYFTDPSKICTEGRTRPQFLSEGTGTDLWLQTGNSPSDVTQIPKDQDNLAGTKWVEGKCFPTMGKHYWYDVKEDMDCETFFPVFLLYNGGKLNGFGWAMMEDLPSDHYEHPGVNVIGSFMQKVPKCFTSKKRSLSTMHMYLTSTPLMNFC